MKAGDFLNNFFKLFHIACKGLLYHIYYQYKGDDHINIEIRTRNKIKEFFNRLHDTLEDLLFSIVQKLPESLIPAPLMEWLESYINKRTQELQQEILRKQWQQIHLEKAVEEIHSKQDKKKAP